MDAGTITTYRNINEMLPNVLDELLRRGKSVNSRNGLTLELSPFAFSLSNSTERCMVLPHRNNNIFLAIVETAWVLAGRNDIEFLLNYSDRMANYSDDGKTWHGAYGTRLMNWNGVNQFREVVRLLAEDPKTRRATMVLFDPSRDYANSKDIPCNNWIHFLIRDDHLDMQVALRSSDVIWGLSGINIFEWSVVLEVLSNWLNVQPGSTNFFISSFHLYDTFSERAQRIVDDSLSVDIYDLEVSQPRFSTQITEFDAMLANWFEIEAQIRAGRNCIAGISAFPDPLFKAFLQMLEVYWSKKRCEPRDTVDVYLEELSGTDLGVSAREWICRSDNQSFYNDLLGKTEDKILSDKLKHSINVLHYRRNHDYGEYWKKRGESGILENIERQIDCVSNMLSAGLFDNGPLIETCADLLLYSLKYETFILDYYDDATIDFQLPGITRPYSEGTSAVCCLLQLAKFTYNPENSIEHYTKIITGNVETLQHMYRTKASSSDKLAILADETDSCAKLIMAVCRIFPQKASGFIREQLRIITEKE